MHPKPVPVEKKPTRKKMQFEWAKANLGFVARFSSATSQRRVERCQKGWPKPQAFEPAASNSNKVQFLDHRRCGARAADAIAQKEHLVPSARPTTLRPRKNYSENRMAVSTQNKQNQAND